MKVTYKIPEIKMYSVLLYIIIFGISSALLSFIQIDKCSTNVFYCTVILILVAKYMLPQNIKYDIDKLMHVKIIKLPKFVKCFIQLNKNEKYCFNDQAKQSWESQENADVDFYTIGHIIMWAIIGYKCNMTYKKVFLLSLVWEIIEGIMGYYNLPFHGRTTDIIFNMVGFSIGQQLRNNN